MCKDGIFRLITMQFYEWQPIVGVVWRGGVGIRKEVIKDPKPKPRRNLYTLNDAHSGGPGSSVWDANMAASVGRETRWTVSRTVSNIWVDIGQFFAQLITVYRMGA